MVENGLRCNSCNGYNGSCLLPAVVLLLWLLSFVSGRREEAKGAVGNPQIDTPKDSRTQLDLGDTNPPVVQYCCALGFLATHSLVPCVVPLVPCVVPLPTFILRLQGTIRDSWHVWSL